jgi:DNA-binding MarR family transcriptional regulator
LRGQYPKPANISLLRDRMLDKMSDVSRLVNRLYKLKLINKQPNEIDKRNTDVLITEKALTLLEEIDIDKLDATSAFHKLSDEDLNTLNEILDRLLEHF